jgi:putative nucleotide binding protein
MFHREPVAFAIGEDQFKLFELVPKADLTLNVGDRVYIGKDLDLRQEVLHVKRRISFNELTNAAQSELSFVITQIIKAHEPRFVTFFNEAQAITTRFHMLELLPGLGKKTMWAIIEERKKGPFKDLADLAKRVPMAHQLDKLVAKRIEDELANPDEKYRLFVAR